MRDRFSGSMVTVAIAATVVAAISAAVTSITPASAQVALKTPWGEPDLQGIWTDEFDTPLQRPAKYAAQEFFTAAQREELDKQRGALYGDDPRQERGTAVDVGGAYNTAFLTIKHARTRSRRVPEASTIRRPRRDSPRLLRATTPATSYVSIAAMVRRMMAWQTAACTAGCPSSAASSAAASAVSCRRPAASRSSTT